MCVDKKKRKWEKTRESKRGMGEPGRERKKRQRNRREERQNRGRLKVRDGKAEMRARSSERERDREKEIETGRDTLYMCLREWVERDTSTHILAHVMIHQIFHVRGWG